MEIKVRVNANVIVLDLSGPVDANSANFVEIVGQCLRDGYYDILCNMEGISSIDYLGISALVLAYKDVANNGGRIKLLAIPEGLKNLFCISGLDRVMDIFSDESLAVKSFQKDKAIENIKKMALRRRFKRLPIDLKIELKDKRSFLPECLKADIINLSAVGAFIFGCKLYKLGDELAVRFRLNQDAPEYELDAKVVWLADKQVQPHMYPGIGIEFMHISTHVQEKIFEFIERNSAFSSSEE